MLAILVFGTPGGFQVLPVLPNGSNAHILDFERLIDLPNTKINIFPKTEIFRIIRIKQGQIWFTIYCKYVHALELKNTRGGTFLGCGIICEKNSLPSNQVVEGLNDLTSELQLKMLDESHRFRINIHEIEERRQHEGIRIPDSVKKLERHQLIQEQINWPSRSSEGFILVKSNDLANEFNQVISQPEYSLYSDVYFSQSELVSKYVFDKSELNFIGDNLAKVEFLNLEINELKKALATGESTIKKLHEEAARRAKQKDGDKKSGNGKTRVTQDESTSAQIVEPQYDAPRRQFDSTSQNNYTLSNHKQGIGLSRIMIFQSIALLFFFVALAEGVYLMNQEFSDSSEVSENRFSNQTRELKDQEFEKDLEGTKEDQPVNQTKDSCEWKLKTNVWVYSGTKIKSVPELADQIIEYSGISNCADAKEKLITSIKTNAKDIRNDSIAISGDIQFILPIGKEITGGHFVDFRTK